MIELKKLLKSFHNAKKGFIFVFLSEQNFRIHVTLGIIVLCAGIFFKLTIMEFIIILICISLLLIMEIINTAFEKVIDIIKPRVHHYAAEIKDILAAAVFIGAILCAAIVLFVFIPHILLVISKYFRVL